MRSPLALAAALLVGCSLPVDDFRAPGAAENDETRDTNAADSSRPEATETPTATKCDGIMTPKRYVASADRCYFLAAGGKRDGESAVAACATIPGAHLVTVGAAEHAAVTALLEYLSVDAWIGLRETSRGEFGWVTGENDAFRAWRDNNPKRDGGACVMAKKDGRWENRKCSDEYVALCER